jgi:hypothetical protein
MHPNEEDEVEETLQATTEEQAIEVSPNHAEENKSEDSSQSETIEVPFSEEALRELEADSPLAAEYWRIAQRIAQESGINSTFTIRKKPPSDTKKVRFVFLEKGSDSKE